VSGLLKTLCENGFTLRKNYVSEGGASSFFEYVHDSRVILLLDTMNYFTTSVRVLGDALGVEKYTVDFAEADDDLLSAYCSRDVEIIKTFFLRFLTFLKQHDLGSLQKTLASQSMHAFRHRFMRHKILIHNDAHALVLERSAYIGGRVEVWKVGKVKERVYKLDVNSMYPAMMQRHAFPCRLKRVYVKTLTTRFLKFLLQQGYVLAHVGLETDKPVYPIKLQGKVLHPVGTFRAVLGTAALQYALQHNHIRVVYSAALYEQEKLFYNFVEFFWNQRRAAKERGDEVETLLFKLVMNSLYGKFGQKAYDRQQYHDASSLEFYSESCITNGAPGMVWRIGHDYIVNTNRKPRVLQQHETLADMTDADLQQALQYESTHSLCAIAAAVTEYARMHLWSLIEQAGPENVYYMDTDSLVVNNTGLQNLRKEIGADLGMLKVEDESNDVVFNAPKDYKFNDVVKLKGVPARFIHDYNENVFTIETWEKFRTGLKEGFHGAYKIRKNSKTLSRTISNRQVLEQGLTASPHVHYTL
jgi:hypothetical protein